MEPGKILCTHARRADGGPEHTPLAGGGRYNGTASGGSAAVLPLRRCAAVGGELAGQACPLLEVGEQFSGHRAGGDPSRSREQAYHAKVPSAVGGGTSTPRIRINPGRMRAVPSRKPVKC